MVEMVWNYAKWSVNFWPRVEWLCKWPKIKRERKAIVDLIKLFPECKHGANKSPAKDQKERTAKHACKQMFGKVERRMPSARKWSENWKLNAERWKPKAGKVQAKCKVAETATEDGKALLNYAKQPTTPNNEQRTTSEQRRATTTGGKH